MLKTEEESLTNQTYFTEPLQTKISVWDKSVKVEENGYYWKKYPVFQKGSDVLSTKPSVVELFCGCGGTSLGFEMADFEIVLGCDIHTLYKLLKKTTLLFQQ